MKLVKLDCNSLLLQEKIHASRKNVSHFIVCIVPWQLKKVTWPSPHRDLPLL